MNMAKTFSNSPLRIKLESALATLWCSTGETEAIWANSREGTEIYSAPRRRSGGVPHIPLVDTRMKRVRFLDRFSPDEQGRINTGIAVGGKEPLHRAFLLRGDYKRGW
ncbi:hypothetical protein SKAU_G00066700 [Synaphobranchus kaupii]|uniref:Uncharacterized protein n=1 Tax=Synaphobranchus kaupii TaxID=118154 RepID=A0A9Q1G658_SYNKA|nr:hypothetical protein SKAU_G00066700 [Synaphobranchus kaupii]